MKAPEQKIFLNLRTGFLYLVIFILPLAVTYFAVLNMISEQYLARRKIIEQQLNLQVAKIPVVSSDDYQFRDFFETLFKDKQLLQKSPKVIAGLLARIDELYPGSFKWIFWNQDARVVDIPSPYILEGQKSWESVFVNIMKKFDVVFNNDLLTDANEFQRRAGYALDVLQRAIGPGTKIEKLYTAREKPLHTKWFSKECMVQWDIDVVSYKELDVPEKIRGGCLVMAFKEALGDNFWLKRFLKRRKKMKDQVPFPVMAFNLSQREPLFIEEQIRNNISFREIVKAYISRNNEIFECGNYLAKASIQEQGSQIRIVSFADLTEIKTIQKRFKGILNILLVSAFVFSLGFGYWLLYHKKSQLSLRKRIAGLFLISIFLPVISLISVGQSFLAHEEKRLIESAYVEMDAGIEALDLRYKDAPRLLERKIFNEVKELVGSSPQDLKQVKNALDKAVEMDLMRHYVVSDPRGKFVLQNWPNMNSAFRQGFKIGVKQLNSYDQNMKQGRKSVLKEAMDEEMEALLSLVDMKIDLKRPSHLRYYVFHDYHTYLMSATLEVEGESNILFMHVPDYYIERQFVRNEFARNLLATSVGIKNQQRLELVFYSIYKGEDHLPEESEFFNRLNEEFRRAHQLKIKQQGKIKLNNEVFLYSIKPLSSMYRQSYIPCFLTSTVQIDNRLADVSLTIVTLAAFASIGAFLLSLILAGSLLGPIKSIDHAAQQVGKGNLNVHLPDMGNDELGRLSDTFNSMVVGLKERQQMQAYVSDSVLEAIQQKFSSAGFEGRTVDATILFADIRNFTGLTESFPPYQIFSLLNEFLGGVENKIRENKGRVDKFIGDAVMAVFYAPIEQEHAFAAIKAAVAIKKFVKELNLERKKNGLFTIKIGVGISTGKVLMGDVGSDRRKDLTVIGDEVNLAARLEAASKKGRHSRIMISGSTWRLVKNLVDAELAPLSEIRGKKQSVKIYELIKIY
jgi:class 3 adenylate cyclase